MRLTLRTLLAYRDGVLDPKDSQVLESKLRESPTARHISQRIDQSLRNPKLAPIPPDAKEPGFDANQIAEYLDDILPTEEIPELERRCLENNALLSEVGSCHSILAKALKQSVEIPDQLRARIHELPTQPNASPGRLRIERVEPGPGYRRIDPTPHSSHPSSNTSRMERISPATMRTSPADSRGSGIELSEGLGHQVPEYLLGSDRSWVRNGLAVASLLAGLVVVGTLALGPTDQLAQMLQPRTPSSVDPSQADGSNPSPKADVAAIPAPFHPISESQKTDSEPNTAPKSSADAPPAVLPDIDPTTPSPSLKDEASVRDGETKPEGELANSARIDRVSDQLPSGAIQWLPVSTDLAEAIVLVLPSPGSASDWAIAQAGMQPSGGVWVVPTTQRTEFRLRGGSRAILCGETELRDIGSSQVPDSTVRSSVAATVPYGRLILFPSPDQTTIQIGTTAGVLQVAFADKDSSCALEIRHIWSGWNSQPNLPRENPNAYATSLAGTVQTECVIELIGLQGSFSATLNPPSDPLIGESQIVEVGDRLVFRPSGSAAVEPLDLTPDWLRSSVERPIDQHSARDISKGLASAQDSPLEAIRQMTSHRKGETASMATRILAQLGDFSPLVGPNGLLGRKGVFIHSSAWLNKLPNFAHSKERILSLVESFVQGEPDRAETLLRLLIPYSNTQLAEGGDRILVEALSSGLLDERVLAIVQLTSLTGKTFSYHPEKNSADSMQQWRKLLSRAEIRRTESAPGL